MEADVDRLRITVEFWVNSALVVENMRAQLCGERPGSAYEPAAVPRVLLPLGARGGVGRIPHPESGAVTPSLNDVIERKGLDLFTARFAERFSVHAAGGACGSAR
ncbi:hypothetical protein ACPXCG_09030 [Gordonia sp. DT218]|uniref:hypothetical protein n=1 Tax=Gordonia sp. DT218 TaxID=3416659 RepID=UPI003CF8DB05